MFQDHPRIRLMHCNILELEYKIYFNEPKLSQMTCFDAKLPYLFSYFQVQFEKLSKCTFWFQFLAL